MEINLFGNKRIEIKRCMNALPEELQSLGGVYAKSAGAEDYLTTLPEVRAEDVQALNHALYRYLHNRQNNILRGALIGQICRIIDPKKHSLTYNGKARRLSRFSLIFAPPLLIVFLAAAVLGFFISEGVEIFGGPRQDGLSAPSQMEATGESLS